LEVEVRGDLGRDEGTYKDELYGTAVASRRGFFLVRPAVASEACYGEFLVVGGSSHRLLFDLGTWFERDG
jgi:hypothetical protein